MMIDNNFTEKLTAHIAIEIFQNVDSCFSWQIYHSIIIKSNQFVRKTHKSSDFLKKQRQ